MRKAGESVSISLAVKNLTVSQTFKRAVVMHPTTWLETPT